MDDELQYLVHFFNDREHLFKTVTMADPCLIDEISDTIASQKGWYWFRYRESDRVDYLNRRRFVEAALYEEYTREVGPLKEKVPVYFYIYPNITEQAAIERGRHITQPGECPPQVLMVRIQDIDDTSNITFTLNDSFAAYWKKTIAAGIKCRPEDQDRIVLPDHNKVFPFSSLERIHRKYQSQGISYEVQVWDYELLSRIRYTILEENRG